jgi:hypothetical protein
MARVLYKARNEKSAQLKKLNIDSDLEVAHRIFQKIRFQESIDHCLHISLYDNKTGNLIRDNDII